eukprot:m.165777 g.165777  ORF g.165777 m.165777 type:complete len:129 (-) comp21087_c0_seq20:924-1310(-)
MHQKCALSTCSLTQASIRQRIVLIGALGRSGSSLMINAVELLLSNPCQHRGGALASASCPVGCFTLPEPLRWAKPDLDRLLDCSFLNNAGLARKVFWSYFCHNTILFQSNPQRLNRCLSGKLYMAELR